MEVYDAQGNVTLSDKAPSMKLTDSGSVSPTGSSGDTGFYRYDVTVTIPGSNKPFLFCVKSDYDAIALWEISDYYSSGTAPIQATISFASTDGGSKDYRLYTSFDFQSYSTTTDFGLKLFDSGGNISYDSRVPEAILEEKLDIPDVNGTLTHKAISEPWYAINMFPTDFRIIPLSGGNSVLQVRGLGQSSPNQTYVGYFPLVFLPFSTTQASNPYEGVVPIVTSLGLD